MRQTADSLAAPCAITGRQRSQSHDGALQISLLYRLRRCTKAVGQCTDDDQRNDKRSTVDLPVLRFRMIGRLIGEGVPIMIGSMFAVFPL